ncbi:MAG: hypothetical protein WC519_02730 [Parcubacteria group bacterium]
MDEKKKAPASTIILIVLASLLLLVAVGNTICFLSRKVSINIESANTSAKMNAAGIEIAGSLSPDGKLAPGVWDTPKLMTIKNVGLLPVRYKIVVKTDTESIPDFSDAILVCVRKANNGTAKNGDWPIIYEGKLNSLLIDSAEITGNLDSRSIHCLVWEFKLDETVDNIFQNARTSFTYEFIVAPINNLGYWQ